MSNEDWYARYRFCSMFATCGKSVFFLAEDKLQKTYVLVKTYAKAKDEDIASQAEIFQDEARLFAVLHKRGLVRFFDQHSLDGKLSLVIDVDSACELMCTHIDREAVERAIEEDALKMAPNSEGIGYGTGVRAAVLEVVVGQAISGAPWREICAGPMKMNGIKPEEVEEEVRRRSN